MIRIIFGILTIFAGLFVGEVAVAQVAFSTNVKMTAARDIKHTLKVACESGEEFCELLCQKKNECIVEQYSCVDCISQTFRLFKTIFTDLNQSFNTQLDQKVSPLDLIEFLRHERWIVLSHDSYYNTFTPEHVVKNQRSFNLMCPGLARAQTMSDALIVVKLDSANRAEKISHVICPSPKGSTTFGVEFNSEVSSMARDQEIQQQHPILSLY